MRFRLAIAACVGLTLFATAASSQTPNQASEEPMSRLLVLRGESAVRADSGVTVLRGSAAPQRAVTRTRPGRVLGSGRYQVVAGQRFWMIDQQTGRLASCRNRGTSNVGERKIECVYGKFGRYSRSFGNTFRN